MPPVEIVTGTLSELEDAFAAAIAEARQPDPLAPVTVIVGHVLLKRYLPRMLAARGVAHINVRFMRPNELAESLSPAADAARARLSPAAERLLVRQVAASADGYFAEIAGRDGFTEALLRLFRELELGGFDDPARLRLALHDGAPDGNHEKFNELAALYGVYFEQRRASKLIAPAERYAQADVARLLGPVLVYGLWAPSELQTRVIERIAAVAPLTVFIAASGLDADDAHAAWRERLFAAGARHRTRDVAPGTGVTLTLLPKDATHDDYQRFVDQLNGGSEFEQLAGALFRDADAPLDAPNVALVSAPDTVREVWEAARACLAWAKDGVQFHEMAVAYRNADPYRALVDEIFREAGISTYLHDGRPLALHPLGIRLLSLLNLAADPAFARSDVMEFLTETRLPAATAKQYGRFRPSQWESYTRDAGIVAGIDQWDARLSRLAAEKTEQAKDERFEWLADEAARIGELQHFARDFHAALTAHSHDATWAEHLAYLKQLAATYADGVEPIINALGDLTTLASVAPRVSFDVFCRAVRDDLESRDTSSVLGEPVRLFGREGVAVVDATSLRHLRFKAVCMLGVAERAWPPPPRPDPLLLEHEREALNATGAGMVPMRTAPDDEPLTFWLDVQAATEHLSVSYARSDAGGSGKHLPSYFFRAIAETLEGRPLGLAELDASAHVRRFEAGRLANDDLAASLSLAEYDRGLVKTAIVGGDAAAVDALSAATPAFALAVQARVSRWGDTLTAYDGVMAGEAALQRASAAQFARVKPVSPSRLEMYAACPYRYFLRYTLGISPVEEPEAIERLDALERGSLIHAILERFLKDIGRNDPPHPESRARHLGLLRDAAAAEAISREERGVTGRPLVWALDKQQIEEDLVRWYDSELKEAGKTAVRPGAFEVGFGGARFGFGDDESELSTLDPLRVRAGDRDLLLQGRIDRIDWDDAREQFRVIDYKTGKYNDKTAFEQGTALQLPVYLAAAAQLLGIEALRGEAQYFYVSSGGGYRRLGITGSESVARRGEFVQILSTIADGVDSGFFAPHPGRAKKNCAYCDFKDICDSSIDRIAERKDGDTRGDAYRALEEIS